MSLLTIFQYILIFSQKEDWDREIEEFGSTKILIDSCYDKE